MSNIAFIKYVEDKPIGFAQCQIRYDYVEGTETSPVGYLEGIFIQEEFRHKGFARELHDAAMLYREIGVTDIPNGWQSEYEWNQ